MLVALIGLVFAVCEWLRWVYPERNAFKIGVGRPLVWVIHNAITNRAALSSRGQCLEDPRQTDFYKESAFCGKADTRTRGRPQR